MIGYRFLRPAEEEMTEASLFYEAASTGLGTDFLNDVQRTVTSLRQHPDIGAPLSIQPNLFTRGECDSYRCSRPLRSASGLLARSCGVVSR